MTRHSDYFPSVIEYIRCWLDRQIQLDPITAGYVVAVRHHEDLIFSKAYGFSRLDTQTEMTTDHLFRIASHTKTFTTCGILMLCEQGHLTLDDLACDYLPELKENPDTRYQGLTLRHLLTHMSGLSRDSDEAGFWGLHRPFLSREEIECFIKTQPLILDPDTIFKYSNIGFELLGWIIERVSGQSYEDFMQKRILDVLALKNIGATYDPSKTEYVTGYTTISPKGELIPISTEFETGDMRGSTSFYGTAESLSAFYAALLPKSEKLLSELTKTLIFEADLIEMSKTGTRAYALGFEAVECEGLRLYGHGGSMPGVLSRSLFSPDLGVIVSIMANGYTARNNQLQDGIWHILNFFKKEFSKSTAFENYNGVYYNSGAARHAMAFGDRIYLTTLDAVKPFEDFEILEHVNGNMFKITEASGLRSLGQRVEFIDHSNGTFEMLYDGCPCYQQEMFLQYLEDLKNQFNG